MALLWLKFAYFEAPELRLEDSNLDDPLGIGSLAYTSATAASLIIEMQYNRTSRSFDEYRMRAFQNFDVL